MSLELDTCKKQADDGHCLEKPEHKCTMFTSMSRIKNGKRKTPRLDQLTALPSAKRERLRIVKGGNVEFLLTRKIIGARDHWLTLVTFNKNSLRYKILDVRSRVQNFPA